MSNDEKDLNEPAEPIPPLVREVTAQTSVVAGTVGQLVLNINASAIDIQEVVRVAILAGQRGGANADENDPFGPEINANLTLVDRGLFDQALDGFRSLQQKCEFKSGGLKSRFRIANNIGVCLMGLGHFAEARAEFNKALSIDPNNNLVRLNLAATYLNTDEPLRALALLETTNVDSSARGRAGALRVVTLARLERYDDIKQFLRGEAWTAYDAQVQLAVAQAMAPLGDTAEVREALRVATDNKETAMHAHELKGMLALGVATKLKNNSGFTSVSEKLPRDRLETALTEFRCAIETCPPGLRDNQAALLAYCGLVQTLLGDSQQALEAFEASRRINHRPNIPLVVNHAALLMERNEFSAAARLIKDSGPELVDQHPHVKLQLGAALLASHADADVIELLANAWRTFPHENERIHGAAMVLDACRRLHRVELGEDVSNSLALEYAECWEAWFHLGRHFADLENRPKALHALQKALSLTNEEDSQQVREELGYRQAIWGDYTGCVATLEPLDITTLEDNAARVLVVSLYNMGAMERARTTAEILLTRTHVSPQIIKVAVAVASQAGDLDRAAELQYRLLQECVPQLSDINCLATILLRKGEKRQAMESLAVDASAMDGGQDAHELMVFAFLLSAVQDKRALTYGYRAWERGRDQAHIQLGYFGLFMQREKADADDLKSEVVVPGTTVTLAVLGKDSSRIISIVRDGDLIPDAATWVRATDPLATRLLGKKSGDKVVGASNPMGQTVYRIDKIESTFTRALRETMSGFNERFPDAEGLWKFELPNDDPSEITKLLLATLGGNSNHINKLLVMHTQGVLPLAALASALKRSVPVVWSGLIHDKNSNLLFSLGADREHNVAARIIGDREEPVYLDYSALMTLVLLDEKLRERIVDLIRPVRIMQSLFDDLHIHIAQAMPRGTREGMNVSIDEDGQLRRAPLGDEHGFLTRVQEIARAVASPCAAYSQFNVPLATREVASKVLGKPTSDLLWEAAETSGILLCDDHSLKVLAQNQNRTSAASVQAVALEACKQGRLTLSEYSILIERLVMARYMFVAIDRDVVTASLERHNWRPTSEVVAVFSCLRGPACNISNAALIGANLLKTIVLEPASTLSRDALVDALLACLTTGHDVQQIARLVLHHLRVLLRLAPIQLEYLCETVQAWVAARS